MQRITCLHKLTFLISVFENASLEEFHSKIIGHRDNLQIFSLIIALTDQLFHAEKRKVKRISYIHMYIVFIICMNLRPEEIPCILKTGRGPLQLLRVLHPYEIYPHYSRSLHWVPSSKQCWNQFREPKRRQITHTCMTYHPASAHRLHFLPNRLN